MIEEKVFYFQDVNENDFYWTETEEGITVTGYNGVANDIVIPERIAGKPVVAIETQRKEQFSNICRIRVPSSVKRISSEAFLHGRDYALKGWIEDLEIVPDNPWLYWKDRLLTNVDQTVLYTCMQTEKTELQLPETIQEIGEYAFYYSPDIGYQGLSVFLPAGVRRIGSYAFRFGQTVDFPDELCEIGLEAIGKKHFEIIEAIKNKDYFGISGSERGFPESIRKIQTCIGVTWKEVEKNPLFSVENGIILSADGKTAYTSLKSDESVTELIIPDSVEVIEDYAFIGLPKLQKVTFGSNLKRIGSNAFLLGKIKTIRIPESVEEIGENAFDYKRVRSVIINKNNKRFFTDKICLFERKENDQCRLIACFAEKVDEYSIPEGIVDIDEGAFSVCENLSKLTLPTTLKTVREKDLPPFLTEIFCSKALEQIEWDKNSRSGLTWKIDPENERYCVENGAVYQKNENGWILERLQSKDKKLCVAENCIKISAHACENTTSLKELELPAALREIDSYAFYGCGLEKLVIPENVSLIGDYAFSCCNLEQVELGTGLNQIKYAAFSGNKISSIFIPNTVNYIGTEAFTGNPLRRYHVQEGNRYYSEEDGCLYDADRSVLYDVPEHYTGKTFIVPESVREIGIAFSRSWNLRKITLPDTVECLWKYSFGERASDYTGEAPGTASLEIRTGRGLHYVHPWFAPNRRPLQIYAPVHSCVRKLIIEKRKQGKDFYSGKLEWRQIVPGMEYLASTDEGYEVFPNEDGLTVDRCIKVQPEITIPEKIHDISVTEIGPCAFSDDYGSKERTRIQQIIVPETVRSIQTGAFSECGELKVLVIPKAVTEIGDGILPRTWGKKVTVYVEAGSKAECYFKNLQSVNSYSGSNILINPIDEFYWKSERVDSEQAEYFTTDRIFGEKNRVVVRQDLSIEEARELTVPTVSQKCEINAFRFTAMEGVQIIHFPAETTTITWSTIGLEEGNLCQSLQSITIDEKNPNYSTDGYAIFDKTGETLLQMVCKSLEKYSVPAGTLELGHESFAGCKLLKEVILPESVKKIDKLAFVNCENLTVIQGLDDVDEIIPDAFEGTQWLQNTPVWIHRKTLLKYRLTDETVFRIPEGTEVIGANSFSCSYQESKALTEVYLPQSMREICAGAFNGCKHLKEVHFNNGLEKIEAHAFFNCSSLKKAILPATLRELGERSFSGTAITAFQVEDGNTSFIARDGVLYSSDMSKLVMVPEKLNTKVFVVPGGVKTIEEYAFYMQNYVEKLYLPESVEKIQSHAFCDCMKLSSIQMNGVKEIKKEAFRNCRNLKKIELNEGLQAIEEKAFGDSSLDHLVLPNSLQRLGHNAFGRVKTLEVFDSVEPDLDEHRCSAIGTFMRRIYGKADEDYDVIVRSGQTGEIKYRVTMAGRYSYSWKSHAEYDFSYSDKEFSKLEKDQKLRMASYRLMYPVKLSSEVKETYEKYLVRSAKPFVMYCIDQQDMELFLACESAGIIKKNNIDELSEYALQKGAIEFSSYLLDYKESHFGRSKKDQSTVLEQELSLDTTVVNEWKMSSSAPGRVMRYRGDDTQVCFPETVNGKKVIGIADTSAKTPENYKKIVSVTIPEGYLYIGKYAFRGCELLERISLPSTLQTIDKAAFQGCTSLQEIYIPDAVTSIGEDVFSQCTSLKKVRLSRKLWELPLYAFGFCHSLRTIDIPPHVGILFKGCLETNSVLTVNLHGLYVSARGQCFSDGVRINHYPCGFSDAPYGVPLKNRNLMNLAFQPGRLTVEVLLKDNGTASQKMSFSKEMTEYSIQKIRTEKLDQLIKGVRDKDTLSGFLMEAYPKMEEISVAVWETVEKEPDANIEIREIKESEDGKTVTVYQYCFETAKGRMEKQDAYAVETKHFPHDTLRDIEARIINGINTEDKVNEIEKWMDITGGNQESGSLQFSFSDVEDIDFQGRIFVLTGFGFADEGSIAKIIEKRGGTIKDTVVQKTDYLIVNENYEKVTAKYKKAVEMNKNGKQIIILSKTQFDKIINP